MPGVEIESLDELDCLLDSGHALAGTRLQGLDLAAREARLLAADPRGAVVLGGTLSDRLEQHLRAGGALVFPAVPGLPVDPYRRSLYTPDELYANLDDGYLATPDARAYAWWMDRRTRHDVFTTMMRAVHDDSVADALEENLGRRRAVGVMGGHAVLRGDPTYRQAARLGWRLARAGTVVLTGGGPGAMEAAALGAALHGHDSERLDQAVDRLAQVPSFRPDVAAWARVAFAVRHDLGLAGTDATIGIPTWFYGHEPSHVFAGAIAKFFSNAHREDLLLERSTAGLVVLPGAAGTVQEVFQAATRSYYALPGTVWPMVLVGIDHWTTVLPVQPLLAALATGREMASRIHLVDTVDEAARLVAASSPDR